MVFSSIPTYLDPANWQQQPNQQAGASNTQAISTQLLPPPRPPPPLPPPPPPPQPHGNGGGTGSIRPGSMADRARLANISMPEPAQKCPRCESTDTKFCYFNNYSLTQPRHFCKTCRRYWTRGGALRNVPVGGGCRRNRRSKGSSSSKSAASGDRQTVSGGSSSPVSSNNDILGSLGPHVPPLRFMAPLHHLNEFTTLSDPHIGLSYGAALSNPVGGASEHLKFEIGSAFANAGLGTSVVSGIGGGGSLFPVGGLDQWRVQQGQHLPFFSGMDSSNSSNSTAGICAFEGGVEPSSYVDGLIRPKISSSGAIQMSSVKMEESQEINLSRQFSGINHGNDQYWSTGSEWSTGLSSFSSSSTGNPL